MDWKDRSKLFCRETLPRLGGNLLILIFFLLMLREILACGSAGNQLMVIFNVLKAWLFAAIAAVLLVPDPDFDLHGDLIKTLCGLNTQRGRVR